MLAAAPAQAPAAPVTVVADVPDEGPDTALLGAALALCAVALSGAGVIARVRRELGWV